MVNSQLIGDVLHLAAIVMLPIKLQWSGDASGTPSNTLTICCRRARDRERLSDTASLLILRAFALCSNQFIRGAALTYLPSKSMDTILSIDTTRSGQVARSLER